ncbi:MAG: lipase family protein [Methylobacter sp.]
MTYSPPLPYSVFQSTQYGLVWLNLANTAYIQQGATQQLVIVDTINYAFNPTPPNVYVQNPPDPANPDNPLQGYWNVDWGPAITDDNSNLMFLVSFRQGTRPASPSDTQGAPCFFAVVLRGTDIGADDEALLQQVLQDFNAFTKIDLTVVFGDPLVPKPGKLIPPITTAAVSTGTASGFTRMSALTNNYYDANGAQQNGSIAAALLSYLDAYPGVPLVVTGHSLGGCQTQIMATYLAWQLEATTTAQNQAIYPNAYAPSTAGDATFAAYYDKLFPGGNFWFNTLDVVPCGFANLNVLFTLWQDYKWPQDSINPLTQASIAGTAAPNAPSLLTDLATVSGAEIMAQGYTRPSVGLREMTGSIPTPQLILNMLDGGQTPTAKQQQDSISGLGMLEWQHFMPAYTALVGCVNGVLAYTMLDDKSVPSPIKQ